MSYARLEDGWVRVPYSGAELARVEVAIGESKPGEWKSAYMNTVNGERVVQVRPTDLTGQGRMKVWIRVDGVQTLYGNLDDASVDASRRRRR